MLGLISNCRLPSHPELAKTAFSGAKCHTYMGHQHPVVLFDVFSGFLVVILGVDANCPRAATCRNTYLASTRNFLRSCQNLTGVPSDIPAEAFIVNLHCNSITFISTGVFSHLTQCVHLNLSFNKISSLGSETFQGLVSLEDLWLRNNTISYINKNSFQGLLSLQNLTLSNNLIIVLDKDTFRGLGELQGLWLYNNKMSFIHRETFQGLVLLKELYLQNNQVSNIQQGALDSLFSLKILDLANNRLVSLDPNLFINLAKYPLELGLSRNVPETNANLWNCLSLCWLKNEEQHKTIRWRFGYSPRCTAGVDWDLLQCSAPGEWMQRIIHFWLFDMGKTEPNQCDPNQITYRQGLPKLCVQLFHSQDGDWFGIFWGCLVYFRLRIVHQERFGELWILGFFMSKSLNLEVQKICMGYGCRNGSICEKVHIFGDGSISMKCSLLCSSLSGGIQCLIFEYFYMFFRWG